MAEEKKERQPATPKRFPKEYEPAGAQLWKCTQEGCGSTATRAVYQHGHKSEDTSDGGAMITWETPAYVDANGKLHKWPCPLCKKELAPVLIKCGNCRRIVKTPQPEGGTNAKRT